MTCEIGLGVPVVFYLQILVFDGLTVPTTPDNEKGK